MPQDPPQDPTPGTPDGPDRAGGPSAAEPTTAEPTAAEREEAEAAEAARRTRLRARGGSLIFSGLILIVAFVLQVADAGYGRDPNREFAERRPYNTVKRDVHEVLPKAVPLALGGLVLLGLGVHVRKRAARPAGA